MQLLEEILIDVQVAADGVKETLNAISSSVQKIAQMAEQSTAALQNIANEGSSVLTQLFDTLESRRRARDEGKEERERSKRQKKKAAEAA